jgi:hypothetical protein
LFFDDRFFFSSNGKSSFSCDFEEEEIRISIAFLQQQHIFHTLLPPFLHYQISSSREQKYPLSPPPDDVVDALHSVNPF